MRKREAFKSSKGLLNGAAQALRFRSRLAYLTSEQAQPADQAWSTEIREMAAMLQRALESAADYIFSNFPLPADSQDLTEFAWLAKCKTPCGQNGRHKAHNVCFHMRKDDGAWSMDRNQLEAALGLWSWSLRQNIKSPRHDKIFGDGGYMKKSIVVADDDESSWQAVVNLWVTQKKLQPPSRVKSTGTLLSVPTETHIFLEKSQALARGSAIEKHEAKNLAPCHTLVGPPSAPDPKSLRLFFRSRNSRLQLLAQDLFTIFMNRVANIIDPLIEVAYNEPHSTDIIGLRQTQFLGLSNPHIEFVTKTLVDAGVASREEALMSVVPALAQQEKLPSIEAVTEALFLKAKAFRREGKLIQSESLLNGLFFLGPKEYRNRALRYLGEVYRAEMRLESPSPRGNDVDVDPAPAAFQQGLVQKKISSFREKVESMKKKVEDMETDSSASAEDKRAARETFQCYEFVLQCHERRATSGTPSIDQETVGSLLNEGGSDQVRKRKIALTMKDERVLSDCNEEQLLGLLRLAIDENIPELIEDMWSADQELIHSQIRRDQEMRDRPPVSFVIDSSIDGSPLSLAIDSNSSSDVISSLVDWPGLRLEHLMSRGVTVLGRAVEKGNEEATRLLLRKGANCTKKSSQDANGCSEFPLVVAAGNGNLEILLQLLKFGAAADSSLMLRALRKAVENSRVKATEILLRYIHDLNDDQVSGYYKAAHRLTQHVIPQATMGQNIAIVKCLKRHGANFTDKFTVSSHDIGPPLQRNSKTLMHGQIYVREIWTTPLAFHCTMEQSSLKFVQCLVNVGADLNAEVDGGNTLIFAVMAHNVEVVEYLLEKGANPIAPASALADFGNALIAACGNSHTPTRRIVEWGHRKEEIPRMLRSIAEVRKRKQGILGMLLSRCSAADINLEAQHGLFGNALIAAVTRAESWVVDDLLRKGADVKARVKRGDYSNALIAAAHLRRVDCLQSMLRSESAYVSETVDDGCGKFRTALDAVTTPCLWQAGDDIHALEVNAVLDYNVGALRLGGACNCYPDMQRRRELRERVAVKLLRERAAFEGSEGSGEKIPAPSIRDYQEELSQNCDTCEALARKYETLNS